MKILRSNYLYIKPNGSYEYNAIKQLLEARCIRPNPKYEKMKKTGRFVRGVTKNIQTFKEERGYFKIYKANYEVYKELLELNLPLESTKDERVSNPIECEATAAPRDEEQKKAIEKLYDWGKNGFGYMCLSALPAMGKSFCAVKLATMFKEKTLILVDMTLLIEQFVETITTFTDIKEEEIGFVRGQEASYGPEKKIIIATAQTLIKRPEVAKELESLIGFLIVDEVHVASANTFQELIPKFKPMYQLGLSGSHNRDDKMQFLVHESVGPIVHESSRQALIDAGSVIVPTLRPIFLKDDEKFDLYNNDETDFRTVVDEYYNCHKVINKVSNLVMHYMKTGRSQLLICKEKTVINAYYKALLIKMLGEDIIQKAECEKLLKTNNIEEEISMLLLKDPLSMISKNETKKLLEDPKEKASLIKKYQSRIDKEIEKKNKEKLKIEKLEWFECDIVLENELSKSVVIITGEANKAERERIIKDANSGKIKVLITSVVLDKAVSINRLDTLYLLFSTRERANLLQRIGRISRSFKSKRDAIVFDFIYDHYMSYYQFTNASGDCRMAVYKEFTSNHYSLNSFIWWLSGRFNERKQMPENKKREFMESFYKKYVIDLNN